MKKVTYPFRPLSPCDGPHPYLPVRITNPHTGKCCDAYGLIDTGADACFIPGWLAKQLGHDLAKGINPAKIMTGNGEAMAAEHTMRLEAKDGSGETVFVVENALIQVMPNLNIILLGVSMFLESLVLTVNYPKQTFSIE
ncbi:MAG: retropepsin-like aspartic protease [Lentisphaeria bacterium]